MIPQLRERAIRWALNRCVRPTPDEAALARLLIEVNSLVATYEQHRACGYDRIRTGAVAGLAGAWSAYADPPGPAISSQSADQIGSAHE